MIMSELSQELEKIHLEIARLLGMDRDLLHFEYRRDQERTVLNLITSNPRHNQSFLYHSESGFGEMDVLNKMLDYVTDNRKSKHSYTIQWSLSDGSELHTSYFRGQNVYEVLDKFYYGKDINSTIIFSISLNPIA